MKKLILIAFRESSRLTTHISFVADKFESVAFYKLLNISIAPSYFCAIGNRVNRTKYRLSAYFGPSSLWTTWTTSIVKHDKIVAQNLFRHMTN